MVCFEKVEADDFHFQSSLFCCIIMFSSPFFPHLSSHTFRYMKIPPVSRFYLTSAFMTTAACAVDIVSPLTLYFNYDLVFHHGQFWRLITPYLFFGVFSVDFLFHMYFLVSR
jgi:Der1-like family